MDSSQFDVRYLDDLRLGYDVVTKELDPTPRIVEGKDVYVNRSGKIVRRPAFRLDSRVPSATGLSGHNVQARRISTFVGINASHIHIVGDFLHDSTPDYYALRANASGSSGWTGMSEHLSPSPHHYLIDGNSLYSKHQSVVSSIAPVTRMIDSGLVLTKSGSSLSQAYWGTPSPPFVKNASPLTSAHGQSPGLTIGYAYCAVLVGGRGHRSSRSAEIFHPASDLNTYAPQFDIALANYSTTAFPKVEIFRTTDGGGVFYKLAEIANTGTTVTYIDDDNSGAPLPDSSLDTSIIAPGRTLNNIPPDVVPPKVSLTDAPSPISAIASFARRIWIAIENYIWFSGQEEIYEGIPEWAFPDTYGIRGNWIRLADDVVAMEEIDGRLVILTTSNIYTIEGTDLTNFSIKRVVRNMGMRPGHYLAKCAFRDVLFFLSDDYQVMALTNDNQTVPMSRQLGDSIKNVLTKSGSTTSCQMVVWRGQGYTWLIVGALDWTDEDNSRLFVYDLDQKIWFPPWHINCTAITVGRIDPDDPNEYFIVAANGDASTAVYFRVMVLDSLYDMDNTGLTNCTFTTNLLDVPAGNHINMLRQPGHHPMLSYVVVERTRFQRGDFDIDDLSPKVELRMDGFTGYEATTYKLPSGSWVELTAHDAPYVSPAVSWRDVWYPVQRLVRRAQLRITFPDVTTPAHPGEIQNIGFVFQSEMGS